MAENLVEGTIDTLGSKDNFAIIVFNDEVSYLVEIDGAFLREGTNENKQKAIEYLQNI